MIIDITNHEYPYKKTCLVYLHFNLFPPLLFYVSIVTLNYFWLLVLLYLLEVFISLLAFSQALWYIQRCVVTYSTL